MKKLLYLISAFLFLFSSCSSIEQIFRYTPVYEVSIESVAVNDVNVPITDDGFVSSYKDDNISVSLIANDTITGRDVLFSITNLKGNLMYVDYEDVTVGGDFPKIISAHKMCNKYESSPKIPKDESLVFMLKDVFPSGEHVDIVSLRDKNDFFLPEQYEYASNVFNEIVSKVKSTAPNDLTTPYISLVVRFLDNTILYYKVVFAKKGIRYDYTLYERKYHIGY